MSSNLKNNLTLVLDDDSGSLKSAHEQLKESGKENVVYASSSEEARSGLAGASPSIVLVSCSAGSSEAESLLADLALTPGWVIGGVSAEQASDPKFLRSAMQARFNDIITVPTESETLLQSIDVGLSHIQGSSQSEGKVVVLYSGKGGSGVTALATNLALALNRREGLKIGLLDLDLQCGLVASYLNLQPTQTLGKLGEIPIEDMNAMREEVLSRISSHESGLRVVASPPVLHDGLNISAEMVTQVIRILRGRFDILVVDTPKWVGDRLVAALDESDRILLVGEPQIPSLAKVRESLRLFSRFEYPAEKVELLFNKVVKKGELQPAEAAEALDREVYCSIPDEPQRLTDAANRGAPPLADDVPKGPFANAMTQLADKLCGDLGFANVTNKKSKRGFLFRRKAK
jgi:pilus assembly protein CpaE